MCGIIGTLVKNCETVKAEIMLIYTAQKRRGKDGFGIVIRKEDGRFIRERTRTIKELINTGIFEKIDNGDIIVFHHREPTSTPNIPHCNHPFMNEDRTIALAHNGVVSHAQKALDKTKKRHRYESLILPDKDNNTDKKYYYHVTDSEIALHTLEDYLEDRTRKDALIRLQRKFSGTFFIIFQEEKLLYFTTNASDLAIYYSISGNTFLSSEFGKKIDRDCVGFFDGSDVKYIYTPKYRNYYNYRYYNTSWDCMDFYGNYCDIYDIITMWENSKDLKNCKSQNCTVCYLFDDCIDRFITELSSDEDLLYIGEEENME